jgi:hypothetical protein
MYKSTKMFELWKYLFQWSKQSHITQIPDFGILQNLFNTYLSLKFHDFLDLGRYLVHVNQMIVQILYISMEHSLSKVELWSIWKKSYNQPL